MLYAQEHNLFLFFFWLLAYALENKANHRRQIMSEPVSQGWVTTEQAKALTDYSLAYLRSLAKQGIIEARKVGRDWLIYQGSLLTYKREMDALGGQRHNPWRQDLARQGRGRQRTEMEAEQ
jgi:hypothetical protein